MACIFNGKTRKKNRVMILGKMPKVIHTGINKLLGKPEDYATMGLKTALKSKNKIDATIPGTGLALPSPSDPPMGSEDHKNNDSKSPSKSTGFGNNEPEIILLADLKKDSTKWTIKVRVTKKYEPRSCKSGTGRMQRINVVDQGSTEMTMLLFDDTITSIGETIVQGGVFFSLL